MLYCGKAASLGIKQAGVKTGKWCELLLTKAPKVTHIAVGHDGMHAIFLTDDGSVFFAGKSRLILFASFLCGYNYANRDRCCMQCS